VKTDENTHIESRDLLEEFSLVLNRLPEQHKVALLQNVGDVDDFLHGVVAHLRRQQKILAEDKVAEGQVRQRLQENQVGDGKFHELWVELVELQHGEVRVEIVGVLLGLLLNVLLKRWKVNGIVAGELQVKGTEKGKSSEIAHRSMLRSISEMVMVVPSSVLICFDIFAFRIFSQTV
jgi:hypothetical protein